MILATPLQAPCLHVRDALLAAVVGTALYFLTCLWLPYGPAPKVGFPEQWALMAKDPFGLVGQFPHRLLAPLLAWCLFLGNDFYTFARAVSVLLLAVVFLFCRSRGSKPIDALLVTLAIAVSGAVQMYKMPPPRQWGGYPDALTFSLLLLCVIAVRHSAVFWGLFFVNLCNHEVAMFVLPWLLFVRREQGARFSNDLLYLGIVLGAYAALRIYIGAHASAAVYTVDYFKNDSQRMFPCGTFWLAILVLAYWLVAFGPLLIVLAWHQSTRANGRERMQLWLMVGGILAVFVFAYDFSRHGNLLLIPIVLASVRFLAAEQRHRGLFVLLILVLAASFFYTDPVVVQHFMDATLSCLVPLDYSKAITCALPKTWLAVLACVATALCLWAIGMRLARCSAGRLLTQKYGPRQTG
ncbi:MAG: hypothetical protein NT107_14815 [Planctomycetota bacterium]|nr:hypothetical protein [Planctomycetota bacterium]